MSGKVCSEIYNWRHAISILYTNDSQLQDEKSEYFLKISYKDQYKIGLINYLFRPYFLANGRLMKLYTDTMMISVPFMLDHILKFHSSAFSLENLELAPEHLSTNKTPAARNIIEDIISTFKLNIIRETETKFFDYTFTYKIRSEIEYLSKLFDSESAAFNFSLDENYEIKKQIISRIIEQRKLYKDFGGADYNNSLDSIAAHNILLADISFFDREYIDAISGYQDAIIALESKSRELDSFHLITRLKTLQKIALCLEKMKNYEDAKSYHMNVIDAIMNLKLESDRTSSLIHHNESSKIEEKAMYKIRNNESSNIERITMLNRIRNNSFLSILFLIEKSPSLGKIYEYYNYYQVCDRESSSFLVSLSVLNFYRNDRIIIDKIDSKMNHYTRNTTSAVLVLEKAISKKLNLTGQNSLKEFVLVVYGKIYQDGILIENIDDETLGFLALNLARLGTLYLLENNTYSEEQPKVDISSFINSDSELVIDNIRIKLRGVADKLSIKLFLVCTKMAIDINCQKLNFRQEAYQYYKILNLIRGNFILYNRAVHNWLVKSVIPRLLHLASLKSNATDRNQIIKYKKAFDMDRIYHKIEFSKFIYTNLSNSPEVQEALWSFMILNINRISIVSNGDNVQAKDILRALSSQASSCHSMFARLNVLSIQYNINRMEINNLYNLTLKYRVFKRAYQFLINGGDQYIAVQKSDRHSMDRIEKMFKQTNKQNNFNDFVTLIANQIFCINQSLDIMQTMGSGLFITNSNHADLFRRLADALELFDLFSYVYEQIKVTNKSCFNPKELLVNLIGESTILSMDSFSVKIKALHHYQLAIDFHKGGVEYRRAIEGLYFLEDDFHENTFHFNLGYERMRIKTGEIASHILKLEKDLKSSQVSSEFMKNFKDFAPSIQ